MAVLALVAGTAACRAGPHRFVRLPLPEIERLSAAAETRPGVWLSPGDSMSWDLPPGPACRLEGSWTSVLAGPRRSLEVRLTSGPAGREILRDTVVLRGDPAVWNRWRLALPELDAPAHLAITARDPGAESPEHAVFVAEPWLSAPRRAPPRTLVLMLVDTLRADHVSAYGYAKPTTPRLDAYFRDGLRAESCFPEGNWTLPSHASLLTSTSVARHGVARYGQSLPADLETLAGALARGGYRTLAVTGGGYVDPSYGFARGFDQFAVVPGHAAEAVARGLAMLDEHPGEPAFLFLHTYQVHDYAPDESAARRLFPDLAALGPGWEENVGRARERMTDPRFMGWIRARYDAALGSVDEAFGRLLGGLDRRGRLARTAVVFTSDHGEALCDRTFRGQCLEWGHGSPYLFEEELHVPLEVRVPWRAAARGVLRENASLLDVAPTLADAAEIAVPDSFEGRSLLAGEPAAGRVVVTEAPPHDALALRQARVKMIRRTGGSPVSLFDPTMRYYRLAAEECFDLARDPAERSPSACDTGGGAVLREAADRYVASSFPDALVLRLPARSAEEPSEARLWARGRGGAPALRTFGLASPPALVQQGAVAEAQFAFGRAPVWIAIEPRDGLRAVEITLLGAGAAVTPSGRAVVRGSYRWSELAWAGREPLPDGAALFTLPPAPRSSAAAANVPAEVAARLLALGYLRGAPGLAGLLEPVPVERHGGGAGQTLAADEVRILHAD